MTINTKVAARILGVVTIVLSWLLALYLAASTALALALGPDRLQRFLGDRVYSALFPNPGALIVSLVFFVLVWVPSLLFAAGLLLFLLSRLRPSLNRTARLWFSVLAALCLLLVLQVVLLDGWPMWLLSGVFGHDTEYAPSYSPLAFLLVRNGMAEEQVLSMVGEPLETHRSQSDSQLVVWLWTRSRNSSNYRVRVITFRQGRVVEKCSEFYLD
jgi:hypothetical protein